MWQKGTVAPYISIFCFIERRRINAVHSPIYALKMTVYTEKYTLMRRFIALI